MQNQNLPHDRDMEVLPAFRGCYNFRYCPRSERSARACLYLHGFPGERGRQNQDLAQRTAMELGLDTYLIHYRGLGKSGGEFSFLDVFDDAENYAHWILGAGYESVDLVGHSFGGWVALYVAAGLAKKNALDQIFLLSPLNWLPDRNRLLGFIAMLKNERPHLMAAQSTENVVDEMLELYKRYPPKHLAGQLPASRVHVFQALRDDLVPAETTRLLCQNFKFPVNYCEIDQEHRFLENRDEILQRLVASYRS